MKSDIVFEAKDLSKKYKNCMVLNQVSFSIHRGDVFGLIGENGAGKTTLMKIIAGSIKASDGKISIMGVSNRHIQDIRKEMGVIIETPAYYGDMTGYENMEFVRLAKNIKDKSAVEDILKIVGLYDVRFRKVSKYSLGMRQRLGIGMALIGEPQFLILDEPTNGLDPKGIVDMRNLIGRLNKEKGITILISSHILTELNQVSTRLGILHKGNLLVQHTAQELQEKCKKKVVIVHEDRENDIIHFLKKYSITANSINQSIIQFDYMNNSTYNYLSLLHEANFKILEYYIKQETLEDYFFRLTKEGADGYC
ncbi:MAG: ABC transporter ATP-binding protein [Lachnospiraceae bacterium]|nr:ABC transporter ATP-binding protein [Lachnospiraceae bacterium]